MFCFHISVDVIVVVFMLPEVAFLARSKCAIVAQRSDVGLCAVVIMTLVSDDSLKIFNYPHHHHYELYFYMKRYLLFK